MSHELVPLKLVLLTLCFVGWIAVCDGWSLDVTGFKPDAVRLKRQSGGDCGSEFRCDSGECVDMLKACDGMFHCADESDETEASCQTESCPSYAFRCAYGGCIDSSLTCDGNDDCADRSDETLRECTKKCSEEEFECGDEACIDELLLCDGKKDCEDGTDEELKLCSNATCPSYAFRCEYGGCVDATLTCDGKPDCADGSDEGRALCRSQTLAPPRPTAAPPKQRPRPGQVVNPVTKPDTNPVTSPVPAVVVTPAPATNVRGCPLPAEIANGKFTLQGCDEGDTSPLCRLVVGTLAPAASILVNECNPGFTLDGNEFSVCRAAAAAAAASAWYPPTPRCVQRIVSCPALGEPSVEVVCTRAGVALNCSAPMAPGSEARIACNVGYVLAGEPNYRKITCLGSGAWDRPLFTCVPAAHCFWDEVHVRQEKVDRYKLALGKFYRDWYLTADDTELQRHDIANISLDERYRGRKRNFQYDVAIVQLAQPAELTWSVNVACVDWDNDNERFQLANGQSGTVSGWGVTEANKPSELLKSVALPYVETFPTCYNSVSEAFKAYLTSDKFCAGFTGNRTSVCPGDSGGGLLFEHATSKRYYLRGIVSVGSRPDSAGEKCYTQAYTAFSKFSDSIKWVEKYVNDLNVL